MIKNRVKCPFCTPDKILTVSGTTGHMRGKHPEKLGQWESMKDEYVKNNIMPTGEKGFNMGRKKKETAGAVKVEPELRKPESEVKPEVPASEIKEPAKIELPPELPVKEGEKQPPEKGKSFLDCLDDLDIIP